MRRESNTLSTISFRKNSDEKTSGFVRGNSGNDTLLGEGGRDAMLQPTQHHQPTRGGGLPPELAGRKDLEDVYRAGLHYAGRCLRGRPRDVRMELVNDAWILLSTTQRWDPRKSPLERWFLLIVRNLINDLYRHEGVDIDTHVAAKYRQHEIDERAIEVMPPDEVLAERETRQERERVADANRALIEAIEVAVAHHPVAVGILEEWKTSGCDAKPQVLADRLGVGVQQIYQAKGVIQYHAKKIRSAMRSEGVES
jgi:DNA-directed RNA polymerase specialized sigma24 family protein